MAVNVVVSMQHHEQSALDITLAEEIVWIAFELGHKFSNVLSTIPI
jgi:hypothetical protein